MRLRELEDFQSTWMEIIGAVMKYVDNLNEDDLEHDDERVVVDAMKRNEFVEIHYDPTEGEIGEMLLQYDNWTNCGYERYRMWVPLEKLSD